MKRKLFKNTSILAVLSIILTFLCVTAVMYNQIKNTKEQELATEAGYVKAMLAHSDIEVLDDELRKLDSRITIIDQKGVVIYDSMENASSMENHLERPEVQDALDKGTGKSVRFSQTLSKESYYYACQLDDGTILRVGNTIDSIFSIMYSSIAVLLLIVLIISVLAVYVTRRQTDRILEPINNLDLEHPLESVVYEELSPLLRRIQQQIEQIDFQLEQQKKQHEEYLAITENMKDGLIVTSRYLVLSINKAAQELFHTTAEECLGQDIIVVNRNQALKEVLTETLSGEKSVQRLEMDDKTYELIGNPVYTDAKITGAVLFIFDITERQKTEIIRQEFSANVSHELKTPLMSISGYAEIMKNGMVKPEHVTEFANRIYSEARRLTTLVEDIIRLSKLDDESFQLEVEDLELMTISREIQNTLHLPAEQKQITMTVEGEEAHIQGMRQIVYEMLYNLSENAVKYNHDGGHVRIHVSKEHNQVIWQVSDDGIGIAKEDQERIFERFYRVDKSHSREIGGTGLGLSIVKHGAALHNARVELESEVGSGTTIRIHFSKELQDR